MVLISSLAAREPHLSDYAASKRAGEEAARRHLADRLTVIRPPAIYGPGDRETLGLFQLAGVSPVVPLPDDPTARLALAYVDDVAAAVVDRLQTRWEAGVYAIGGARPDGYGWRDIFTAAATAMDRSPALIALPPWLITGAAALAEAFGRLRGAPAIFNRGKARELLHRDWSVSAAEQPPGPPMACVALETGFRQTVAWYRTAGWLAAAAH